MNSSIDSMMRYSLPRTCAIPISMQSGSVSSKAAFDQEAGLVERFLDGFQEERHDLAVDNHLQGDVKTGPISHAVLFGFDYQHLKDRVIFSSGDAPILDYRNPDYDEPIGDYIPYLHQRSLNENYGIYLQDQISFDEHWILTLGGRQDWATRYRRRRVAGRLRRSGRSGVHLSRRPDLSHRFWTGALCQLWHLLSADAGSRRRRQAVQADHRATI